MITELLANIADANGGIKFIRQGAPWNATMRGYGRQLCAALGYLGDTETLSDNKLWSVYISAMKDVEGGKRAAQRLNPKGATPLAPSAPSAPTIDLEAIKAALLEEVRATVKAELLASLPTQVVVTAQTDGTTRDVGLVHNTFPLLLAYIGKRKNAYLFGPAGTGKTTSALKAAEAVGLPFYSTGKITTEFGLLGFIGPNGNYFPTQFRQAYENGGVFLFDEIDRSHSAALTALNMALANKICAFPDGVVRQHKDFVCIAAGNTAMNGSNRKFNAAQQVDLAFKDRFAFIPWGYDEALELALAPDKDWCATVQRLRAVVEANGFDIEVSPRATYDGGDMLADGTLTREQVLEGYIFKGCSADIRATLSQAL